MYVVCVAVAGGQGVIVKEQGWIEALTGKYSRAILTGCALFIFQQFAGINAIVYFSSTVFRQVCTRGLQA
jgi:Sugar (and other) transporter